MGKSRGSGYACGTSTTPHGLHSSLTDSLFLGTHTGYHFECDLRILHFLELECTRVRQKVDKGCRSWQLKELVEPHDTSNGLLQQLVRTLQLFVVLLVDTNGGVGYSLQGTRR